MTKMSAMVDTRIKWILCKSISCALELKSFRRALEWMRNWHRVCVCVTLILSSLKSQSRLRIVCTSKVLVFLQFENQSPYAHDRFVSILKIITWSNIVSNYRVRHLAKRNGWRQKQTHAAAATAVAIAVFIVLNKNKRIVKSNSMR